MFTDIMEEIAKLKGRFKELLVPLSIDAGKIFSGTHFDSKEASSDEVCSLRLSFISLLLFIY